MAGREFETSDPAGWPKAVYMLQIPSVDFLIALLGEV